MNEVRLDKEEQNMVIASAVKIMQQRIVGKLDTLKIDNVDQEFLALRKEDVGKKFPEFQENDDPDERRRIAELWPKELDVISVSRAIEESVRDLILLKRPHILEPFISRGPMLMLGAEVIGFLSWKKTEKIKPPHRIAAYIEENMIRMEGDISTLETLVQEKLVAYESLLDESEKSILAQEIYSSLISIGNLSEELRDISDTYDFSSLPEKESDWDETDWDETDDDTMEDDEWINNDVLTFEEDIHLSLSERHLLVYIPETLKKYEELFEDSFFWFSEWEEWERSDFHIRDFPERHREMLEKILHRKRIIAFCAKIILERESKEKTKRQKFSWPWLWKIRKFLPELEEEIQIILWKIESLDDNEDGWQEANVTSEPTGIRDTLEETLDYLFQTYETALYAYVHSPEKQAKLKIDIKKLSEDIIRIHWDLANHCIKHNLESQHIAQAGEWEKIDDDNYPTVEEYLESPDFFEDFPTILITEKSDSEKNLLTIHTPSIAEELLPAALKWDKVEFIYQEDDGSESPDTEKMKIIEEVLHILLRRKMIIYFECLEQTKDHPNEESRHHFSVLKREIEFMQLCTAMLANRIKWLEEPKNMWEVLVNEIEYFSQKRFHLFQVFMEAQDGIYRQIIGAKIFPLFLALNKRKNTLQDTDDKIKISGNHVEIPGISYSESRLLRYILTNIREWENDLFARKIPFSSDEGKSVRENELDMEKAQISQLLERKMMVYFFAMKRIDEIDIELSLSQDNDIDKLVTEREEIRWHSTELNNEVTPLLQRLQTMNESTLPRQEAQKKLYYQELYYEAMKIISSIDGIIANTGGEHTRMVRDYWERIQKKILHFSDQIQIEESKWNLHRIPALQKEFDTEMAQIISDITQYLGKILAKQWHKGNEQHVLTAMIRDIREKLFGSNQ